ncbi:3-dehydroquinate synthase [Neomegalonema sp.]|uniref:3-dehydroquinate synthase n=1 Tax=Neomegalonema sp. TaxID=2039713 RepID=UPI0026302396|nr:3-dehydroquinate synthase [Neomegalonema sp.]MDD2866958.1 3-dehydroquinate synthase [Neomegalonema sp.]
MSAPSPDSAASGSADPLRRTLRTRLEGGRDYEIVIGPGLIKEAGARIAPLLQRPYVAIVADGSVARLHLTALKLGLAAGGVESVKEIILPPGEKTKAWGPLAFVTEELLEARIERKDMVLAFGGGVTGDLVGFAAAILRRGLDFVQIPTSLLAQVDSSVGGKTGINTLQGKNLVGAFHQPRLVLADTALLDTLPPREFLSGYAEVVKYGLLGDRPFFEWLERNGPALKAGDPEARAEAVARSCSNKAGIVERDETEQGERMLLNLGHTFGHALEAATEYSARLLHGEGVSIGCALAFEVSARMGLCPRQDAERAMAHLRAMGLKTSLGDIPGRLPGVEGLMELMAQDKKVSQGALTFILVRGIGEAFATREADLSVVRDVLADELADR